MENGPLQKDDHHHAQEGKYRRHGADVQRDELSGNGGANIGAHDDPYRLLQCHHAGVYKPHYHDGRCRRRLNHRRDAGTHSHTQEAVGSQPFQDSLHPVAGGVFQAAAHHLHAVEEQRQSSQQVEQRLHSHLCNSLFLSFSSNHAISSQKNDSRPGQTVSQNGL